jgi:hypothetical protein
MSGAWALKADIRTYCAAGMGEETASGIIALRPNSQSTHLHSAPPRAPRPRARADTNGGRPTHT